MNRLTDILLIAAILFAFTVGGFLYGERTATHAAAVAEQARTAKAVQAQRDADAAVLADERALHARDTERFATYQKEQAHAKETTDRIVADLRAGAVRLRIPIQRAVCPAAPDGSPAPAAGTGDEGYADLAAGTAESLIKLTGRGDDAIRKHAAVVDLYDHLRAACAAPAAPVAAPAE